MELFSNVPGKVKSLFLVVSVELRPVVVAGWAEVAEIPSPPVLLRNIITHRVASVQKTKLYIYFFVFRDTTGTSHYLDHVLLIDIALLTPPCLPVPTLVELLKRVTDEIH